MDIVIYSYAYKKVQNNGLFQNIKKKIDKQNYYHILTNYVIACVSKRFLNILAYLLCIM